MEKSLIIAGFGGQGVMLTGKILGYAATDHNKKAVFLPQYGTQQRGGTASCNVIFSDDKVGCPIVGKADNMMIFNQPSMEVFVPRLKKGGLLMMNSTLCSMPERDDITIIDLPVDDIALGLGSQQVANLIMLGAFVEKTGLFTVDELVTTMQHLLSKHPEMLEVNEKALREGAELIRKRQ